MRDPGAIFTFYLASNYLDNLVKGLLNYKRLQLEQALFQDWFLETSCLQKGMDYFPHI